MKSEIRSALLGRAKVRKRLVEFPDLKTSIEVWGVTAGARGRLINRSRDEDGVLDYEKYYAMLVIETAHDPESGDLVFGEADLDALNGLPQHVVDNLATTAEELSGGGNAHVVLEKNSDATGTVATASDSQKDSDVPSKS